MKINVQGREVEVTNDEVHRVVAAIIGCGYQIVDCSTTASSLLDCLTEEDEGTILEKMETVDKGRTSLS